MKLGLSVRAAGACFLIIFATKPIDNPHFYRATHFWGEPHFEKKWLSSLEISFGGGSTRTGYNYFGKKVPILDIYGPQNVHFLGKDLPGLNPADHLDKLLMDVAQLPSNASFGILNIPARFQILESIITCWQNLINGFFFEANLPIRRLKTTLQTAIDLSPDEGFPQRDTLVWQSYLQNFDRILARHGLSMKSTQESGAGDLSILVGWARNYEETSYIDFIDVNAKIGLLFPTGKQKNPDVLFSLPLGYNGHFGVPFKFDASFGLYDWLTFGTHIGALFFFSKTQPTRIKTSMLQEGSIYLFKTNISVEPGTIWDANLYIKADHMLRGFSTLFGYSFNIKEHDVLAPPDLLNIPLDTMNSEESLQSWTMHTIQIMLEYDFATYCSSHLPRLGLFFNIIVAGKRIFTTNFQKLYFGMDLAWNF